jgi:hypothetical protein
LRTTLTNPLLSGGLCDDRRIGFALCCLPGAVTNQNGGTASTGDLAGHQSRTRDHLSGGSGISISFVQKTEVITMFNHFPTDALEIAVSTVSAWNQELSDDEFNLAVMEQSCLLNGITPDHYWDCEPEFPSVSHR